MQKQPDKDTEHTDLRSGLHGAQEQRYKPWQAVLVHGVNACQVSNAEEEQAGPDSHRAVLLSGSINFLLCAFRLLNLAGDVIASSLQCQSIGQ